MAKLPYTYVVKGVYWRFRRGGLNCPLPGQPGESAFHAAYAEKMAAAERKPAAIDRKSFRWLIKRYRESAEFRALADPTQLDYGKTLDILEADDLADQPYRYITWAMVKAVRDDFAGTPRKAHKVKQMVSALYGWADQAGMVPEKFNPAAGLKKLKTKGGDKEIVVWSDHEIALFLQHAKPHIATPVMLALYTGQRLSDVVAMTWSRYQTDMIRVRQSKTRALLDIACHSLLRRHLDAIKPKGRAVVPMPDKDVICLREDDVPWSANAFGSAMSRAVRATPGMPHDRSMHGLRYAAGSTMEEAGCTVAEIESVLGHQTFKMALKYASQRLRAKAALAKIEA
ncbi:tyrosine-type recombinase/integrase [Sphingomonas sp. SRS2]|uniref:tyrosine-type recombinase/integrase n=1 Tax=Sphingomonas sp. SRS2 TaxID=133190 RepID=UPI00128B1511|nr:tyrosine-type recombinase/integrase [Sphingomonas sp. SRS2]